MARLLGHGPGLQPDEGLQLRPHRRAPRKPTSPGKARSITRSRTTSLPTPNSATSPRPASSPAWSCRALGDFLIELDAIKEGDGTLLDNSLIMAFSDTGYAKIHSIENIPMFLAGGAGGRHKAGQHIAAKGESVTRVSLTAMQLVGAPVGEFGSAR